MILWCSRDCPKDVDGDGNVGIGDILEVLSGFGQACN